MSTVSWGKRNRYRFGACGALSRAAAPIMPGVYAITYKQDPQFKPKAHTVVFFGDSSNLSIQLPAISADVRRWWHEHSADEPELFVFLHPMPGSTEIDRARVRSELVSEYDPQGNA
jgi:hypothetical protein